MVAETTDNNVVIISGRVASELKYSHEIYGEGFYQFLLDVPRLSDSSDNISVTISERLIGKQELMPGSLLNIEGQFRSYNSFGENGSKLLLTVFARELSFAGDEGQIRNSNKIYLNGYICKKPVYRSTPFGREITDLLIAVNRAYNKSDYIPCISWGRNARFCASLSVGDNIRVWGRIQSRTYQKKVQDGATVTRVAYEVSLSKLEMADARRLSHEEDGAQPAGPETARDASRIAAADTRQAEEAGASPGRADLSQTAEADMSPGRAAVASPHRTADGTAEADMSPGRAADALLYRATDGTAENPAENARTPGQIRGQATDGGGRGVDVDVDLTALTEYGA